MRCDKQINGRLSGLSLTAGWVFLCAASTVWAGATANWLNPIDGQWSDPTQWSTSPNYPNNGLPNPGDSYDAVIDATGSAYIIKATDTGPLQLDHLTLNSPDATVWLYPDGSDDTTEVTGGIDVLQGELIMMKGLFQNTTVRGGPDGSVLLHGGTYQNVVFDRPATLRQTRSIRLMDQLTINSTLTIQDTHSSNDTYLLGQGTATLNGTGEVVFEGYANNSYITTNGTLTIGPDLTIRSDGTNGWFYHGRIINEGLILADDPDSKMILNCQWTNHGVLEARNGGHLSLSGQYSYSDIGTVVNNSVVTYGGEMDNHGNHFTVTPAMGQVELSADIQGGQLSVQSDATATVNGLTLTDAILESDLVVDRNSGRSYDIIFRGNNWQNNGQLTLTNGAVALFGGQFWRSMMGDLNAVDGTVLISGVLDNIGSTLQLEADAGRWIMERSYVYDYPQIVGGRIEIADGQSLQVKSGILVGVTLAGEVRGEIDIADDITLDGGTVYTTSRIYCNQDELEFKGNGTVRLGSGSGGISVDNVVLHPDITLLCDMNGSMHGPGVINQGTIRANPEIPTNTTSRDPFDLTLGQIRPFINYGRIISPEGGKLRLYFGEYFENLGEITVDGGLLQLDGEFDQSLIGPMTRNGGTVQITGVLNNVGKQLTLDQSTGDWEIGHYGTIQGGRIVGQDGVKLIIPNGSTRAFLDDSPVLDIPVVHEGSTRVFVNENLTINDTWITKVFNNYASIEFQSAGPTLLGGAGEMLFRANIPDTSGYNWLNLSTPSLTIGPDLTLATDGGHLRIGQSGYNGDVVLQGTLSAQSMNDVHVYASSFECQGLVRATNGGLVWFVPGSVANVNNGVLTGGQWVVGAQSMIDLGISQITENNADIYLMGSNAVLTGLNAINRNHGSITFDVGHRFTTDGGLNNDGQVTIGQDSALHVQGDLTLMPNSALEMDWKSQFEYFMLEVDGVARLDGALRLTFDSNLPHNRGEGMILLVASELDGQFDDITTVGLPAGWYVDVNYSNTIAWGIIVPEPATLTLLAIGGAVFLRKRPKHIALNTREKNHVSARLLPFLKALERWPKCVKKVGLQPILIV